MSLRKATGNMYKFVTRLWNPVKGKCPYACSYCYVSRICRRFGRKQRELRANLGNGNTIFVCDSIDLFAPDIPLSWLESVVMKTRFAPDNTYLWHTKNPGRATGNDRVRLCPSPNYILCVTIESNIYRPRISNAPPPIKRFIGLRNWKSRRMITVEPIMRFDTAFVQDIIACQPEQVNIGADSGHNNLPEPSAEDVRKLIVDLEAAGIRVVKKANLRRLLDE